ncbi:MAG: aldo/keto reductase [Nitrososphaerales archaeon]
MRFISLGNSGLKVSQICLGTNNFGGYVPEAESGKIINKAIDSGVNIIDTANVYTEGKSEQVIGKLIEGRREDLIVATKFGMETSQEPNKTGSSRKNVLWQLEQSLNRLSTSYIDLYYVHRFDPSTPLLETLRALDYAVKSGKIRYIACSNFSSKQLAESLKISSEHDLESFVGIQSRYNLLQRELESEIIPFCEQSKVSVLAYNPLRAGLLAGRYSKNELPKEGTRAFFKPIYWQQLNNESNFQRLEKFQLISEKSQVSMPKLAIAWALKKVSSVVVGASSPQQIEEACEAAKLELKSDTLEELEKV